MSDYHYHNPTPAYIPAPAVSDLKCPFCSCSTYRRGIPCSDCGMIEPSRKSEYTPNQLLKRKQATRKHRPAAHTYTPTVDGVQDTPEPDQDELSEYAADLAAIDIDADHTQELADDALLPTQDELSSLPWD